MNNYSTYFFICICFIPNPFLHAQQLTYISDGSTTYQADLETCVVEEVHHSRVVFHDITFCPVDKKLYGIALDYLWELDLAHDSVIYIMDAPDANAITCDKNGLIYCAIGQSIRTLDLHTGKINSLLNIEDYKSDGDLTFYEGELYLSVRGNGLLKIVMGEDTSYLKTNIATGLDSIWGMTTEFGECEEDFYLMAQNDVYQLDENMVPRMHCENIIEYEIWGATSNTEVLSDFELQLDERMALCENNMPLEIDASQYSATYLWNTGSEAAKLSVYEKGEYWVDVTVGKCTKRDTVDVFFQSTPVIDLGEDIRLCDGQVVRLDAFNEGGNYIWQDGSDLSFFDVSQNGRYLVEVNVNGCINTDTISFEYYYCQPKLEMPNVLTPNYDGFNDKLVPKKNENIVSMYTSIYNRFGKKVFETDNPLIEWSPYDLPAGLYYYLVNFTELTGQQFNKKGWVQVLK